MCVDVGSCERVDARVCVWVCHRVRGSFPRVQPSKSPLCCDVRGHSPVPRGGWTSREWTGPPPRVMSTQGLGCWVLGGAAWGFQGRGQRRPVWRLDPWRPSCQPFSLQVGRADADLGLPGVSTRKHTSPPLPGPLGRSSVQTGCPVLAETGKRECRWEVRCPDDHVRRICLGCVTKGVSGKRGSNGQGS